MTITQKITFDSTHRPAPRSNPFFAFDDDRNRFVVYGGFDNSILVIGTHYEFDVRDRQWYRREPLGLPAARAWAQMTYDLVTKKHYVFGGVDDLVVLSEMLEFDGALQTWTPLTPTGLPAARASHGQSYDSDRKVHVLFGGIDAAFATVLSDLHEYDSSTDTWAAITPSVVAPYETPPAGRGSQMQAYDSVRKLTVMVGGIDIAATPFVETWLWDGVGWRKQTSALHPPGPQMSGAALAYVAALKGVVLFGGSNAVGDNRAWLLTQDGWTELFFGPSVLIPVPRDNVASGSDGTQLLMACGADAVKSYDDIWGLADIWTEFRTGFVAENPTVVEFDNGLRLAGSPPYSTAYQRVDCEGAIRCDALIGATATQVTPTDTEIRYAFEIDGVEYTPSLLAWPTFGGDGADAATLNDLLTNTDWSQAPILSTGSTVRLIVFIRSTTGTATPELDEVQVEYDFADDVVVSPKICVLHGIVRDSNGPVPGAAVRVRPTDPEVFNLDQLVLNSIDEVFTDANGYWELSLFETETASQTVEIEVSYTGHAGLTSKAYSGVTVPNQPSADLADLVS